MPTGYLVQLGDRSLDIGDVIVDGSVAFTTDTNLGSGQWIWSGTVGFSTFTNQVEPGVYYLATDGNVYFVPDFGLVTTITSSSVVSAPAYTSSGGEVTGTNGSDIIDSGYTGDPDGDVIDGGDGTGVAGNEDIIRAYAGDDTITSGDEADTVYAGSGDDTVDAGSGGDRIIGGSGSDTIHGGDGADVIYGDGTSGGSNTLNENYTVIRLGTFADADPTEFNALVENAGALLGTYGSGTDPLYDHFADVEAPNSSIAPGGVPAVRVDSDGFGPDAIFINGTEHFVDWVVTYNATITYDDGTTAPVTAVVFQTTDGEVFVAPETAFNTDNDAYEAGPIESISFDSILNDGSSGSTTHLSQDRADVELHLGAGNDIINGGAGADTLFGNAGDDTITVSQGDTADGGDGDDTFLVSDLGEAGSAAITIVGGEGDETAGDTLDFQGLGDPTTLTFTNTDDAAGSLSGSATLTDGSVVNFAEIENIIICFAAGTHVLTPLGERRVETLKAGDLVLTADNGLQPVRWVGKRTVAGYGKLAPVRIAKGALQNERDLLVSPQHRMLLQGWNAQMLFGEHEVLAAATHLLNTDTITREETDTVTYVHLCFDKHEVIFAEGTPSESFHPGHVGLEGILDPAREELFRIFPELRCDLNSYGPLSRTILRKHETHALIAA